MNPLNLLEQLVEEAKKKRATDIHFVEGKDHCTVKFRVDNQLILYGKIELAHYRKMLLYIKYKSNMRLNNAYGPQSSAFNLLLAEEWLRIRVSTIVTERSENLVLRLSHPHYFLNLTDLFFIPSQKNILTAYTDRRNGLILLTGPTGSGKTTLAYALLNELKRSGRSIVSVEDPVEHYDDDFVQLQINEAAGIDYEVSIKEILRHDPDLIFIGEIRDYKSAKSAIRASLTGHLVISTLHATSALKALDRLIELGITLSELEQVLQLVTNQRLGIKGNKKAIVLEWLEGKSLHEALAKYNGQHEVQYETINQTALNHRIQLIKG